MNKALLPAGFHDLLYPDAKTQHNIVVTICKCFEEHGYRKVEPPVIEFEESLFSEAGEALSNKTFRLMDPSSHKMMGVRADMTTQVARIATTRLINEPKPIRLSYSGDVFRVKGEGLYAERQFMQAGVELIGAQSPQSDAQVVLVTAEALKEASIDGLCIDFTIPGMIEIVLDDIKITGKDREDLITAISKKDSTQIKNLCGKKADIILQLIDPGIDIKKLCSLKLPKEALKLCKRLGEVFQIVKANRPDIAMSIDPIGSAGFAYHKTLGFSIFSKNTHGEIGRGGIYITSDNVDGVGATLYVNELFRMSSRAPKRDTVFVACDTNLQTIRKLRENGQIVIISAQEVKDLKSEAKQQKCTHVFIDGDIFEV